MAINETSTKILTDTLNKTKDDKGLLVKMIADVNNRIDNLQANKQDLQKQINDCNKIIDDLKLDLGIAG